MANPVKDQSRHYSAFDEAETNKNSELHRHDRPKTTQNRPNYRLKLSKSVNTDGRRLGQVTLDKLEVALCVWQHCRRSVHFGSKQGQIRNLSPCGPHSLNNSAANLR